MLFADIKGSMELIEDIDLEEVRFIEHYESTSEKFGRHRSNEFYGQIGKFIAKHGIDRAAAGFGQLMPWGRPDQVPEKLAFSPGHYRCQTAVPQHGCC